MFANQSFSRIIHRVRNIFVDDFIFPSRFQIQKWSSRISFARYHSYGRILRLHTISASVRPNQAVGAPARLIVIAPTMAYACWKIICAIWILLGQMILTSRWRNFQTTLMMHHRLWWNKNDQFRKEFFRTSLSEPDFWKKSWQNPSKSHRDLWFSLFKKKKSRWNSERMSTWPQARKRLWGFAPGWWIAILPSLARRWRKN